MLPAIDLPRALLRGRYTAAVAAMEAAGTPIDTDTLQRFQRHWDDIKEQLIVAIDADYDVYDGTTFKAERFAALASREPDPVADVGERPSRSQ